MVIMPKYKHEIMNYYEMKHYKMLTKWKNSGNSRYKQKWYKQFIHVITM